MLTNKIVNYFISTKTKQNKVKGLVIQQSTQQSKHSQFHNNNITKKKKKNSPFVPKQDKSIPREREKKNWKIWEGQTKMRSKRVAWSTLTNSRSQFLSSSSAEATRSSAFGVSTCFLQYSMTFDKILLVTFGRGIPLSAQSSSIMCFIVWDSNATASSTSKVSPSELFSVIFLDDIVFSLSLSLLFTSFPVTQTLEIG